MDTWEEIGFEESLADWRNELTSVVDITLTLNCFGQKPQLM